MISRLECLTYIWALMVGDIKEKMVRFFGVWSLAILFSLAIYNIFIYIRCILWTCIGCSYKSSQLYSCSNKTLTPKIGILNSSIKAILKLVYFFLKYFYSLYFYFSSNWLILIHAILLTTVDFLSTLNMELIL